MRLFRRRKTRPTESSQPAGRGKSGQRRRPTITPLEVKLLALEALQTGLTKAEVADIIGVAPDHRFHLAEEVRRRGSCGAVPPAVFKADPGPLADSGATDRGSSSLTP